jgi:hypothetical protein
MYYTYIFSFYKLHYSGRCPSGDDPFTRIDEEDCYGKNQELKKYGNPHNVTTQGFFGNVMYNSIIN